MLCNVRNRLKFCTKSGKGLFCVRKKVEIENLIIVALKSVLRKSPCQDSPPGSHGHPAGYHLMTRSLICRRDRLRLRLLLKQLQVATFLEGRLLDFQLQKPIINSNFNLRSLAPLKAMSSPPE